MYKLRSWLLFIAFNFLFQFVAAQQLKMPAIFSDNMVLQQKTNVPVWGWNTPGREVQVTGSWNHKTVRTLADNSGKWMLKIKTPAAGGPYTLTVKGEQSVVFQNVMIGEVWICSGQSNMEMPMAGWTNQPVQNSEPTIKESSNYPDIRLFNVQKKLSAVPLSDCKGSWKVNSPKSVASFSATGYYFGLELYKKLKIPVGLIMSAWGGTPSESWTPYDEISKYEYFRPDVEKLQNLEQHKTDSINFLKDLSDWQSKVDLTNMNFPGTAQNWKSKDFDDSGWNKINQPTGWWNDQKWRYYRGIVWFRKSIVIPQEWEGKDLSVELGPIDEMDMCWINDYKLGEHMAVTDFNIPRKYILPAEKVKSGANTLVIRMININEAGGLYGTPSQLKIYSVAEGDSKAISLAGEWKYKTDVYIARMPAYPVDKSVIKPDMPGVLFNGMINPVIPFAIKGSIWYQGESNVYDANLYSKIFPSLVKSWREKWNQGVFPFYYVQIAPFGYGKGSKSQLVREAQLHSLDKIPNSGMAVTMDVGTIKGIHPPYKDSVGRRLAVWALSRTYKMKAIAYSGPLYKSMKVEGPNIRIMFDHANHGLTVKGEELTFFEIAGADQKFVPAKAYIDNNTVVVSSPEVAQPVAVRYGWSDTATPNLFNTEGFPASSFRTDDWDN
ncbi:MAG: sialate O-acetylesterase [Bacteroidota bacterium]|nr:sialate O-acetylesterase [Bacteroidota bacterium]